MKSKILLVALCLPTLASADPTDVDEETASAINELISIIMPAYDCVVAEYSVSGLRLADENWQRVIVKSSGKRCDEALRMLNYRGKSKGWVFWSVNVTDSHGQPVPRLDDERNQDLIHEIDPEGAL